MPICFGASNLAISSIFMVPGFGQGLFYAQCEMGNIIISSCCISVTGSKLIVVTVFTSVAEMLRLDCIFVILELSRGG